jgi:hypothetical protein
VTQRSREGCWWLPVGDGLAQEIGRESEGKKIGWADRAYRPNWRERGRKEFLLFSKLLFQIQSQNDF